MAQASDAARPPRARWEGPSRPPAQAADRTPVSTHRSASGYRAPEAWLLRRRASGCSFTSFSPKSHVGLAAAAPWAPPRRLSDATLSTGRAGGPRTTCPLWDPHSFHPARRHRPGMRGGSPRGHRESAPCPRAFRRETRDKNTSWSGGSQRFSK